MKPIIDLPSDYKLLPGEEYKALDIDEEMPMYYYVGHVSPTVPRDVQAAETVYWFDTKNNRVAQRGPGVSGRWELQCDKPKYVVVQGKDLLPTVVGKIVTTVPLKPTRAILSFKEALARAKECA